MQSFIRLSIPFLKITIITPTSINQFIINLTPPYYLKFQIKKPKDILKARINITKAITCVGLSIIFDSYSSSNLIKPPIPEGICTLLSAIEYKEGDSF